MSTKRPIQTQDKQAGMVAIMVTLILMMVISLLVIGFSQISRRNQRQTLDRQLSTQAFYAAESGINDATKIIKTAVATGTAVSAKPTCASDGGGFYAGLVATIDTASDVKYTCLTVDPSPNVLVYSSIGSTSTVAPLNATAGTIASVRFTWQTKDDTTTPATTCPATTTSAFVATSLWTCGYGVLRVDLVPTAGAALTMANLQSQLMTTFMIPLNPAGTGTANPIGFATAGGNSRLGVVCSNTSCTQTISGLTSTQYYVRVSSIYKDVSLRIEALDASNNPINLQGAQAIVDATGKAQDVLRRLQVRIPLTASSTNLNSDFAIQSTDAICKRFAVMTGYFVNDADNAVPSVVASTTNDLCKP